MSQLSFDVIKRVWPKSGLVTLFKKYSRVALSPSMPKASPDELVLGQK